MALPDFKGLERMIRDGKNVDGYINNYKYAIQSKGEIEFLNKYSKTSIPAPIRDSLLLFNGDAIFKYGDYKSIGKAFPKAVANKMKPQILDRLLHTSQDFRGLPIRIDINNIGELPLDEFEKIQNRFDIETVFINEYLIGGMNGANFFYSAEDYHRIMEQVNKMTQKVYIPLLSRKTI